MSKRFKTVFITKNLLWVLKFFLVGKVIQVVVVFNVWLLRFVESIMSVFHIIDNSKHVRVCGCCRATVKFWYEPELVSKCYRIRFRPRL